MCVCGVYVVRRCVYVVRGCVYVCVCVWCVYVYACGVHMWLNTMACVIEELLSRSKDYVGSIENLADFLAWNILV